MQKIRLIYFSSVTVSWYVLWGFGHGISRFSVFVCLFVFKVAKALTSCLAAMCYWQCSGGFVNILDSGNTQGR